MGDKVLKWHLGHKIPTKELQKERHIVEDSTYPTVTT